MKLTLADCLWCCSFFFGQLRTRTRERTLYVQHINTCLESRARKSFLLEYCYTENHYHSYSPCKRMPTSYEAQQHGDRPPPGAPRKQVRGAHVGSMMAASAGVRIPSMNGNDTSTESNSFSTHAGPSFRSDITSACDAAASLFGGDGSGPSILEGVRPIGGPSTIAREPATASWLSGRMLPPSEYDQPAINYTDTPTGRNVSSGAANFHQDRLAFQTPSAVRPTPSSLYEQLSRGMAATRKQNGTIRTSLASSSGWGSPRNMATSGFRLGTQRFVSGESSGLGVGSSRIPGDGNLFNTPQHNLEANSSHFLTSRAPSIPLPRFSFPQDLPSEESRIPNRTKSRNSTGINRDGSYNVVRDEEDANNSGLLALTPAMRDQNYGLGMTAIYPRMSKGSNASSSITSATAAAEKSKTMSEPSDRQSNATFVEHALEVESYEGEEAEKRRLNEMRTGLRGQGSRGDGVEAGESSSSILEIMRNWREDAMKHHLYDTAIFWGDKILSLETGQIAWNDAYNLATAYFLTHRYAQAEHLLRTPLPLAHLEENEDKEKEDNAGNEDAEEELNAKASLENDHDELSSAIAATHKSSRLPAAMLAKAYASQHFSNDGHLSDPYEDRDDLMTEDISRKLDRKRKDRQFTISGTGTASEGGTSAPGSVAGDMNGEMETDRQDIRGNHGEKQARHSSDEEEISDKKVNEAWREEQNLAMDEVRRSENAPPDGISLVNVSIPCRYLAAQCMTRQGKYQEALDELSDWKSEHNDLLQQSYKQPSRDGLIKLSSSIWHLKGLIQLHLRNTEEARESFMRSLSLDIKNYESFDHLVRGHLLTATQQWDFIQNLEYVAQAGDDPAQLEALHVVRLLYTARLDKSGRIHAQQAAAARRQLVGIYGLGDSPDVLLGLAEEMFSRMRYEDAYTVTQRIMELCKDHEASLPVHISTMYMIERLRPALYLLAHHLTDTDPDMAAGWYAVGCWYFGTKRWLEARKYFSKAVQMDPRFSPGWVAFAHTFAYEGESDQAVISYSTAERNFSSHYLIKLFLGMEHLSQGNLTLAELYLTGSAEVWEEDALSRNERGVVAYYSGKMEEAVRLFRSALEAAKDIQQPAKAWISTHLNLAFALRKIGQLSLARQSFLRVLELDPDMSIAYTGVAMCLHGEGQLDEAITWYHRALASEPTDKHANELLSFALQECASRTPTSFMNAADRLIIEADDKRRMINAKVEDEGANLGKDPFGIKIESGDQTAAIQSHSSTMDEGTREMTLGEGSVSIDMDESY